MTDKELKKLSRIEVLELLLNSEKQKTELEQQLEEARQKNRELTEKLNSRELDIQEAGNIADASLKISGIFQCAQAAAESYLDNVKSLSEKQEAICAEREAKSKEEAERLTSQARAAGEELLARTGEDCTRQRTEAESYCTEIRNAAEKECLEQKEKTAQECQALQTMTDEYCTRLRTETESKCSTMEAEVTAKCEKTKADAKKEMESYWAELSGRMEEFYKAHEGMREMLSFFQLKMPEFPGSAGGAGAEKKEAE